MYNLHILIQLYSYNSQDFIASHFVIYHFCAGISILSIPYHLLQS
jgi:hypothetical protein